MTNTHANSNRYRVSSKFILLKIGIYFGLLALIYSWGSDIYNHSFGEKSIAHLIGTVALVGILYLLTKTKIIEYDDIKCILYIFNSKGKFENEIPVEKIDKILFSSLGFGRGSYSYVIVYRDVNSEQKKVRLFPIAFNNDIDTIITDTKLRNPEVVTRNWSFGWNEFFD
jgi:hypothetical protein